MRIINLVENEPGSSGCYAAHGHYDHSGGILPFAELNPSAKIYMQHNAGGEVTAKIFMII